MLKLWNFLYKSGIILFIYFFMFVGAVSLVSITQKGTVYYGDRCNSTLDSKALSYLNQEEIIAYDYNLQCNTLYIDLVVDDTIKQETSKALLVRIYSYYDSIDFDIPFQISLKGANYLILASLDTDGVSMTVSNF